MRKKYWEGKSKEGKKKRNKDEKPRMRHGRRAERDREIKSNRRTKENEIR